MTAVDVDMTGQLWLLGENELFLLLGREEHSDMTFYTALWYNSDSAPDRVITSYVADEELSSSLAWRRIA